MPVPSVFVRFLILTCVVLFAGACLVIRVSVSPVEAAADSTVVRSPVRAHLKDGSTVVFRNGVTILRDTVRGNGERFSSTLAPAASMSRVALDSVLGMETFRNEIDGGRSAQYTVGGLVAAAAVAALAVAALGSCPTFYYDSGGTRVIEAEGFSYSVAPLLEARDIDRLRARPDSSGILRLEVRNEALETHYVNHLELLEVTGAADEYVVPDERGRPLGLRAIESPRVMRDKRGVSVVQVLEDADDSVYRTGASTMATVSLKDMTDYIDVSVPRPAVDSVVLLFRMRNSLLNTVLFYDFMLARPGALSLDWLSLGLDSLAKAVELGRWYGDHFGLRVSVLENERYREVARVGDQGPIAWHDVGLVVPVPADGSDSLKMRLSFIADEWRIDRVAMTSTWRRANARAIPISTVTRLDGTPEPAALESMRKADDQYLETTMGQALIAGFDAGPEPARDTRTFMLASQGHYSEWVRGEWIRSARTPAPFVPSDSTLLAVVKEWRSVQADMERQFFATRIPVR
ncbi:MAG: hypothetical protein ABR543_15350 [Gemmatimonadaceae bacterium]